MSGDLVSVSLTREEQLTRELNNLADGLREKAVKRAITAAAKPIAKRMKAGAPDNPRTPMSRLALSVGTASLRNGDTVGFKRNRQAVNLEPGQAAALVGPIRRKVRVSGAKAKIIGAPAIAAMLEGGTSPHKVGSVFRRMRINGNLVRGPVNHPGIRPVRWMESAYNAGAAEVADAFFQRVEKFLNTGK